MAVKTAFFTFVDKQLFAAVPAVPNPIFVTPGLFDVRSCSCVDYKFHFGNSLLVYKKAAVRRITPNTRYFEKRNVKQLKFSADRICCREKRENNAKQERAQFHAASRT